MSDQKVHPVPAEFKNRAHIDAAKYEQMYRRSIDDPDGFWSDAAEEFVTWTKKWNKVMDYSFNSDDLHIKWFDGGKLNVAYNCLDRHLDTRGDQTALICEEDDFVAGIENVHKRVKGSCTLMMTKLSSGVGMSRAMNGLDVSTSDTRWKLMSVRENCGVMWVM